MSRKVLSIQNIQCETLGELERMLRLDGFEIDNVNAKTDILPRTTSGYSALVILGGPMAVYDNLEYIEREMTLVKEGLKNNTPILGICLGSQIIAEAIGGQVFKGSTKEIGWHQVSLSNNDLFAGLPSKSLVFQWHGDTFKLPEDAQILAESSLYPQAFRMGSAVGIQFHLEVNKMMVQNWTKEYKAELYSEKIRLSDLINNESNFKRLSQTCEKVYSNFSKMI